MDVDQRSDAAHFDDRLNGIPKIGDSEPPVLLLEPSGSENECAHSGATDIPQILKINHHPGDPGFDEHTNRRAVIVGGYCVQPADQRDYRGVAVTFGLNFHTVVPRLVCPATGYHLSTESTAGPTGCRKHS